jgi:hypothetical protein
LTIFLGATRPLLCWVRHHYQGTMPLTLHFPPSIHLWFALIDSSALPYT